MQVADTCQVAVDRLREMLKQPAPLVAEQRWVPNQPAEYEAPPQIVRIVDNADSRMLLLCLHRPDSVPAYITPDMFSDPALRSVFAELLDNSTDDLAGLIDSLSPTTAEALGQLAVMDEPSADPERIVGHFLHDAAIRRVGDLQLLAERTGDITLMPVISDIRLLIPKVRASSFDLTVAAGLVPLLG